MLTIIAALYVIVPAVLTLAAVAVAMWFPATIVAPEDAMSIVSEQVAAVYTTRAQRALAQARWCQDKYAATGEVKWYNMLQFWLDEYYTVRDSARWYAAKAVA